MKQNTFKLKLLLSCILVSGLVAITYYLFESAVHSSINFIWDTKFDTDNNRLLILPLLIFGALLYFGFQHLLDPKSENKKEHSLGDNPIDPKLKNFAIILLIGYLSLVGGASLGPEAVLVPACTLIGTIFGVKLFYKNKMASKALAAAAIMALMAAFFHSYIIGILSVFLVTSVSKTKLSAQLIVIAIISSLSSFLVLNTIDPEHRYFNFPEFSWKIAIIDLAAGILLVIAGYIATFVLKYSHTFITDMKSKLNLSTWWQIALLAGTGLGLLYLIGGPLIEFTGNQSIAPLIDEAPGLGLIGLMVILVTKIFAIAFSKAMGYRGGLIFPMVFVASTLVAISQIVFKDVNFGVGLIAAVAGILIAEKKAHILL